MKTEEEIRLFLKYLKTRMEECEEHLIIVYMACSYGLQWVLGEKTDHPEFAKFKQENKE
jgi:hypothetical protein